MVIYALKQDMNWRINMENLLEFIKKSPTMFHATKNFAEILEANGFIKLSENKRWDLHLGGKYYLTRNNSAVLCFTLPNSINELSYNIAAAHTDSPTFKLKPNFTLEKGRYSMLNCEIYGGPILNSWMDRPLNIAGRIIYKDNEGLKTKLLSFDRPMAVLANCSIHYYHELNTGVKLNPQTELVPLVGDKSNAEIDLLGLAAKELGINKDSIVSHDLYLAVLDRGTFVGANNDFIMAPQIDNLECSYGIVEAIINSKPNGSINVGGLFDNEEIGSRTRQGAGSQLLSDTLERISDALGYSNVDHKMALANSFMVSADNAQGFHPNYAQKYDPTNAVYMNDGIVIKNAARGSYTTDGMSQAYFKTLCEKAGAKYQLNTNRSDVPGGSTLGAISLGSVSIHSVDIGLPQIAMHSCMETAGARDLDELVKALKEFYSSHLVVNNDGELTF